MKLFPFLDLAVLLLFFLMQWFLLHIFNNRIFRIELYVGKSNATLWLFVVSGDIRDESLLFWRGWGEQSPPKKLFCDVI